MSKTKFQITRTGEYFYYDNKTNGLYDNNGNPLSQLFNQRPLPNSTTRKTNTPETIKIVLGHACNYSCGYCVQKDIGNPNERPKNMMTTTLLRNIQNQLDPKNLKRIELWGGETLLYWKDIVSIMTELDDEKITWYIPTNGTPLQQKHTEFFSRLKGKVTIGISHDGPGHENTRGPEFLHKKTDVLKSLQQANVQFSFNSVISVVNYDLFEIDSYFRSFLSQEGLQPVPVVYELGRVYDKTLSQNSFKYVISGEHVLTYQQILRRYLHQHIEEFKNNRQTLLKTNLVHFGNGVIPYATTLRQQCPISFRTNCGVDLEDLITFDINGNVRTCQNTSEEHTHGSITNLQRVNIGGVSFDKGGFCDDCNVLRLCKSSCPIDLPQEVFLLNHTIEHVHYSEVQLAAFSLIFDSEIIRIPHNE